MGVTATRIRPAEDSGASAEDRAQSDYLSQTFTHTIIARTDPNDQPITVAGDVKVPQYGTYYGEWQPTSGRDITIANQDAYLASREIRKIASNYYEIRATWSTEAPQVDVARQQAIANPLTEPWARSWRTVTYETFPMKDLDGKPIVNGFGDPFDSATPVDKCYSVMTIERNEASFDWRKAAEYNGATNADWFAGFPPGSCKLEMTADERVQGDIVYVRVRYEIAVNLTVDWQNNPLGWDVELLNKGSRGLGPEMLGTKVHYAEADRQTGAICAFEYLLDLDGNMLPKDSHGRQDPFKRTYLRFRTRPRVNFSTLRLTNMPARQTRKR